MTIELSTIAAGLPMAASFAMASGFVALREGRRRSALNAAMHELRRPLQAISLSLPSGRQGDPLESSLEMAVAAMDQLDREINGSSFEGVAEPLSPRSIVAAAVTRWEPAVHRVGRTLRLKWSGADPVLKGDPLAIARGVDNLISNALEHGKGAISVEVEATADRLHLAVKDRGQGGTRRTRLGGLERVRLDGRNRRGYGLAIVRRVAAQHGGSFCLRRSEKGTEAALVLPVLEEVR
ncbi:MAG TPA: HAMP domain-containing sensor histidine kinase [Solirubrobacterales bacterium]|nr:HAMP domain-containing sensor histidine kinase [Solirubrobacterales bacterium]